MLMFDVSHDRQIIIYTGKSKEKVDHYLFECIDFFGLTRVRAAVPRMNRITSTPAYRTSCLFLISFTHIKLYLIDDDTMMKQ